MSEGVKIFKRAKRDKKEIPVSGSSSTGTEERPSKDVLETIGFHLDWLPVRRLSRVSGNKKLFLELIGQTGNLSFK